MGGFICNIRIFRLKNNKKFPQANATAMRVCCKWIHPMFQPQSPLCQSPFQPTLGIIEPSGLTIWAWIFCYLRTDTGCTTIGELRTAMLDKGDRRWKIHVVEASARPKLSTFCLPFLIFSSNNNWSFHFLTICLHSPLSLLNFRNTMLK